MPSAGPPLALSDIPIVPVLYKLSRLSPPSNPSAFPPSAALNARIALIRADITSLAVGAIVNAANESLLGGGGVDGAIHSRAGPDLLAECRELGGCETGSSKITDAYELPCSKVIHAVGPVYWRAQAEGNGKKAELLKGCYVSALELARENTCKSIAFSCISTGVYGYPPDEAAEVACAAVREWLLEREKEEWGGIEAVVFCCFEPKDERAYEESLPKYFPPTEGNAPAASSSSPAKDASDFPSPPKNDPSTEDSSAAPAAKKTKLSAAASTNDDAEWETVEHSQDSAPNGHVERPFEEEEGRATSTDEDVMSQEEKEVATAALHTAQTGGDPPRNVLEKDW